MKIKYHFFIISLLLLLPLALQAQHTAETVAALEATAKRYPKNAKHAFAWGQALVETGEYEKAISPLGIALKSNAEALELRARAYYMLYLFEEAKDDQTAYISRLQKAKKDTTEAEKELNRINRAARMLENCELLTVIDSLVVRKEEMFQHVEISPDAGRFEKTSLLLPNNGNEMGHISALGDRATLSIATNDNGFDLYGVWRLGNKWGDLQPIAPVNSKANEIHPFVRQDGRSLIFARDGSETLGGYDLYMTRIGATGSFLEPTPLGMPFNSPYNDYLLVYDETAGLGYLVSDRYQTEENVCIYTFIFESETVKLPTDDLIKKREQATLRDIHLTQNEDTDYKTYQRKDLEQKAERSTDFTFVVEGKVYYRWQDFRSAEARNIWREALLREKELEQHEERLQKLRYMYSESGANKRSSLKDDILKGENTSRRLRAEVLKLTVQARKVELNAH